MYGLTFHGKEDVRFERVSDPSVLAPTDAIVQINLTAICGSDLHIYRAHEEGLDLGTVLGHEFVGEIVELGRAVKKLAVGQQVVSPFTTNCGHCYFCLSGLTCRCEQGQLFGWVENGVGLHGAQAEYVRVPLAESTLVPYAAGLDAAQVLLTGDIMATGRYCARQAGVHPGGTYVVVGCGPVGLMCVLAARQLGAFRIYATDLLPERLALAGVFGATPLPASAAEATEVLLGATQGRGADAVMEAVGHPSASRLAYQWVRPGGTISTVGVHTRPQFAFSPVEAYNKNLTFKIGRAPARYYMESLQEELPQLSPLLDTLISHRMPLEHGPFAYHVFDQKLDDCMKILLYPSF